jgi:hypothetical protein
MMPAIAEKVVGMRALTGFFNLYWNPPPTRAQRPPHGGYEAYFGCNVLRCERSGRWLSPEPKRTAARTTDPVPLAR